MKIWYSICGEGLGHINRSLPIIGELKRLDHNVQIFSYGHTKKIFDDYIDIPGVNFANNISYYSLFSSFIKFRKDRDLWIKNQTEKPDLIISDFEPVLIKYAQQNNIPCVCVDNQHKFAKIDWSLPTTLLIYNIAVKLYLKKYFNCPSITTTFHPQVNSISPIFLEGKRKEILVYIRDCYVDKVYNLCKDIDADFVFYTNVELVNTENIKIEKLSPNFKERLSSVDGVITNGGNQLISECIQLGVRLLSFPIEKQYEQYINCHYIKKNGYGATTTIQKINKKLIEEIFLCPKQMSLNQLVEKILSLYLCQTFILGVEKTI